MTFNRVVQHVLQGLWLPEVPGQKDVTFVLICRSLTFPGNLSHGQQSNYKTRGHFAVLTDGHAEK
jgi:hypothetical protein